MSTFIKYIILFSCLCFSAKNDGDIYDLFELSSGESTNTELIQIYEYYRDNPIDLRYVSVNDITVLPFIDYDLSKLIIERFTKEKPKNIRSFINSFSLDKKRKEILLSCLKIGKQKSCQSIFAQEQLMIFKK